MKVYSPPKRFMRIGYGPVVLIVLLFGCLLSYFGLRLANVWTWMAAKQAAREAHPIDFYGRVTDRDGQPLADAIINYNLTIPNWPRALWAGSVQRTESHIIHTDQHGRFEIHSPNGTSLQVRKIHVIGFTWHHTIEGGKRFEDHGAFYFAERFIRDGSSHKADPDDPVLFVMERVPPN